MATRHIDTLPGRAHKAANPQKYPIKQEVRDMYPALKGIEERFGPTPVHLQVYDGALSQLSQTYAYVD